MTRKEIALKYKEQIEVFGEIFIPDFGTYTLEDLKEPKDLKSLKKSDENIEENGGNL